MRHFPPVGPVTALPLGMLWQLDQSYSSIQLQIIAGLEGDYSGDGAVDAGDYTVWRDTYGSDSNLAADGNGNGVVDEGDLLVWRANFGRRMPPEEVRSGISARAILPLEKLEDVLVIPVTALLQEEGAAFVFRVIDDKLQRVPVILGARIDQQQVINEGLAAGEQIVVRDVAALSDGQPVVIELDQS